jgi:hypothetical protein
MNVHAYPEGAALAIKILIIVFLVVILYSLASALVFLVKDHGEGDRTVKRLTWRIGLSLVLFLFLWFAYQMGWVQPHQGPVGLQMQQQETAPDSEE